MVRASLGMALVAFALLAACGGGDEEAAAPTSPAAATSPAAQGEVVIELVTSGFAFNTGRITVPAGAMVVLRFRNEDGVSHNFALYTDERALEGIFSSELVGARSSAEFRFTAPSQPGEYFFRCNVHPNTMTGTFVVE